MPIPVASIEEVNIFERVFDPHSRLLYTAQWGDFLAVNETEIVSAEVVLSSEAVALGIEVADTTWEGTDVSFWLTCSDPGNAEFDSDGVTIGMLIKIEDDLPNLSQKTERTLGVIVRQR